MSGFSMENDFNFCTSGAAVAISPMLPLESSAKPYELPSCCVHRASAFQAALFTCCYNELNTAMRDVLLFQNLNAFEHRGNPRFVIAAKNRCSIAADIAIFPDLWLDTIPWSDCIHMRCEENGRNSWVAVCCF